jgi:hypothetical protein
VFKIKLKEFDQRHSQEAYSGTHDCENLCRWISNVWVAACTHSHLFYRRLQATHGWGRRPHDQWWTSEFRNKEVDPQDGCQMHDAWSMWSCVILYTKEYPNTSYYNSYIRHTIHSLTQTLI